VITAVDSNVLIDVFGDDPRHYETSKLALRGALSQGKVVCSEVVYAELAGQFEDVSVLDEALDTWSVAFSPLSKEAARAAGATWRQYRRNRGTRGRLIADFLVGAHAATQCDRLLTRDRGFYRNYFQQLTIVDPSKS
jgi:predicted nucleic acid-binding protein